MTKKKDHKRAVRDFATRNGMSYQAALWVFRKSQDEPSSPPQVPLREPPQWPSPEHIIDIAHRNAYDGFNSGMAAIQRLSAIAVSKLGRRELNRGTTLFERMPPLLPWLSPAACLIYLGLDELHHKHQGLRRDDPRYFDAAVGAAHVVDELMKLDEHALIVTRFEDAPQPLDCVIEDIGGHEVAVVLHLDAFPTKPWRDRARVTAELPMAGSHAELIVHDHHPAVVVIVHQAFTDGAERALRSWNVMLGEHARKARATWGEVVGPMMFR